MSGAAGSTVILFDLDGTLLESIDFILDCFRHAFVTNGLPPRPDEYWKRTIGTPIREQLSEWEYGPEKLEAVLATYRSYNLEHHDTRITAYGGVRELLAALRERGVAVGVVTSKSRAGAQRGLVTTGLAPFVQQLVSVDDVTHGKPHPEPVLTALSRFNATSANAFFVGDSVHDMLAGRAAGVKTVAALWGPFERCTFEPAEPDFWCDTPTDVLALLDR